MLLAIDAGNTNIVFAVFDGDAITHTWRCQTNAGRTADEYASWLYQLFQKAGLAFSQISASILCSVVPDAEFHLKKLCVDNFGSAPVVIDHKSAGIKIGLPRPEEAGADRLVNALAVIRDYGSPAIVIDFGTATTFDVIDEKGVYCGGVIAPGVNLSMQALYEAAAKLPRIEITPPEKVIGHNTVSAMQSGVYWGYVAMIEGMLARIAKEMGSMPRIIATGGLARLFADTVPAIESVDETLTLRGMLYVYAARGKQKAA